MSLVCACLDGPDISTVEKQVNRLPTGVGAIELRFDLFKRIEIEALRALCSRLDIPVVFTLRHKEQGGRFDGSHEEQLRWTGKLAALQPDYFDIEFGSPVTRARLDLLKELAPRCRPILSHHDFKETPEDCLGLLKELSAHGVPLLKLATWARSTRDALRLMTAAQRFRRLTSRIEVIAVAMGPCGEISRTLGGCIGSPFVYGHVGKSLASGQLSVEDLINLYRVPEQDASTRIFGLIGSPVDKSQSHLTHNQVFRELEMNAVYVKVPLKTEDLAAFFLARREFAFHGFSVTMPLKELVLPYIQERDPRCLAVNTLLFGPATVHGYSTDGVGALNAIEERRQVKGKRVVVLGAGGAAQSIAAEAVHRGGRVTLCNRTEARAHLAAKQLEVEGGSFSLAEDLMRAGADFLINATSVGMAPLTDRTPIDPGCLSAGTIVMDAVSNPQITKLLEEALHRDCEIISGSEMFVNQAVKQFALWTGHTIDETKVKQIITKALPWPSAKFVPANSLDY